MVREFWLKNGNNEVLSLMQKNSFFHNPNGLGFELNLATESIGDVRVIKEVSNNFVPITGEIKFFGTQKRIYDSYEEFAHFISVKPLFFYYQSTSFSRPVTCEVLVTSLQKGEIGEDHVLTCPITFERLTHWLDDDYSTLKLKRKVEKGGKNFPLSRPYKYVPLDTSNVRVENTGNKEAPMIVEIIGAVKNPQFSVYTQGGKLYGICKILGDYDYVRISSEDDKEELALSKGGVPVALPLNFQDFSVANGEAQLTFIKLQVGVSFINFELGENFSGVVNLSWRKIYATI